jgi:hypothetical protein
MRPGGTPRLIAERRVRLTRGPDKPGNSSVVEVVDSGVETSVEEGTPVACGAAGWRPGDKTGQFDHKTVVGFRFRGRT